MTSKHRHWQFELGYRFRCWLGYDCLLNAIGATASFDCQEGDRDLGLRISLGPIYVGASFDFRSFAGIND